MSKNSFVKQRYVMKKKHWLLLFVLAAWSGVQISAQEGEDYPINFDVDQEYTHASRHLDGVSLNSGDGNQTFSIAAPRKVYTALLDCAFTAKVGETVTPSFNFNGGWMHGFVYLDRGNDGKFDAELNADGTFSETSDIMAFSYSRQSLDGDYGYNSNGDRVDNSNVLQPPSFVIPADLPNGFYRMRYKVDWVSIDPAGRMTENNSIIANGGGICDIRINIHGDRCNVKATAENGNIVAPTEAAFGEPLTVSLHPDEGYVLDGLRIRHGYNLDGERLLHGTPQYDDVVIPGFLITDGEYTISPEIMNGDVRIEAIFIKTSGSVSGEDYAHTNETYTGTLPTTLVNSFTVKNESGDSKRISVPSDLRPESYRNLTAHCASAKPGEKVSLKVQGADGDLSKLHPLYLYIDLNQDGTFSPTLNADGTPTLSGELVAYNRCKGKNSLGETVAEPNADGEYDAPLPDFVLPSSLSVGVYRARLVAGGETIEPFAPQGASTTDFLINVHNASHPLRLQMINGSIHGSGVSGLPENITYGTAQMFRPLAAADGYVAEQMTIRHGHHLDGPQYIHGNRQWGEYTVPARSYSMPADSVDGEVRVSVAFEAGPDAEYALVFSDEFEAADGTLPDADKWVRCGRFSSTWNRWHSITDEEHALTAFLQGGRLVARTVPNPFTDTDNVPMITGAVKTMGKFGFTYGKVECRAKSNPWKGNFPAIWLMPEDQSAGWPNCGEIDIWEMIDTQNTSYHTVHSNWTYNLGNKNNPKSSFNLSVPMTTWHTYGLEWDETSLTWYVDGQRVGSYEKSTSDDALSKGQWPFDKDYHVILNQSVGNGSWAANADVTHTYETEFDWVRVYQLDGQTNTGIRHAAAAQPKVNIAIADSVLTLRTTVPTEVRICDLTGRTLHAYRLDGSRSHRLPSGIYLVNSQKVLVF